MAKRVGGLFPEVHDFGQLLGDARRARQGTGRTLSACRFFFYLERELLRLRAELQTGRYQPGPHQYFHIRDPKPRRIAVAPFRDRVVHHAVVRVLTPVFEPTFIHDSYATRKGKGTHAAIERAQVFLRQQPWYLKADVQQFFDSVDHAILLRQVARKVKDRPLLALIERIVGGGSDSGRGLPIGNLPSQFFANVYLNGLDHHLKEALGARRYLRYMDDLVLFADTRVQARQWRNAVADYLDQHLALALNPSATWINQAGHGLSFLGHRIFPNLIRVRSENRRRSLRKLARRMRAWEQDKLSDDQLQGALSSLAGYQCHFPGAGPLLYPPRRRRDTGPGQDAKQAAPTESTGAAAGTTTRPTSVAPTATTTTPATGTTTSASVS
jgi:RNA-directed DNA polymerase